MSEVLLSIETKRKSSKRGQVWDKWLTELRHYKEKHGDVDVSKRPGPDRLLGEWVCRQRAEYRKLQQGKQSQITPERVAALEEIGLKWNIQKYVGMVSWEEKFKELRKYKKKHGDVNVPQRYLPNLPLARWVMNQRQEYRRMQAGKGKGWMTPEKVSKLNDIGMIWKVRVLPKKSSFDEWLEDLKQYKEQHGDCNVKVWRGVQPRLGVWVYKQRKEYQSMKEGKPTKLTEEQVATLEDMGFDWRLTELQEFADRRKETAKGKAKAKSKSTKTSNAQPATPRQYKELKPYGSGPGLTGRPGDIRMHRAVEAKLSNPNMSYLDALLQGGFTFPDLGAEGLYYKEVKDADGVKLVQRKNQLARRLRRLEIKK